MDEFNLLQMTLNDITYLRNHVFNGWEKMLKSNGLQM